jgi:hypothetical protein
MAVIANGSEVSFNGYYRLQIIAMQPDITACTAVVYKVTVMTRNITVCATVMHKVTVIK